MQLTLSIFTAALCSFSYFQGVFAQAIPQSGESELAKVFHGLKASPFLNKWTPCNGTFECARLEVSLDYYKSNGTKATIALTRSKGKASGSNKRTYLINPGGPGIPGTQTLVTDAYLAFFRAHLGDDVDIIGWDPRGVGYSTPNSTCLSDDTEALTWWAEYNSLFFAEDTKKEQWAALKSLGTTCNTTIGGEEDIGQYSSTAVNARDMKAIVKALDGENGKLNYMGLSYGTVYGMTFASMFPEMVGSMILDGNTDPSQITKESGIPGALADGPKVFERFYTDCAAAGQSRCAFYSKNPKDIEKRLNKILDGLEKEPMAGTYISQLTGKDTPITVTRNLLELLLFLCTYVPADTYHLMAQALAFLELGSPIGIGLFFEQAYPITLPSQRQFEAEINGLCADFQIYKDQLDLKGIQEEERKLLAVSPFAGQWVTLDLACRTWPIKSKERYLGPFGPGKGMKTKGKMLFVNNKYDPVTPYKNAKYYSQVFGGGLLTIDGIGHTSLATFSECSAAAVQAFVAKGTLPAKGKSCKMGKELFSDTNSNPTSTSGTV